MTKQVSNPHMYEDDAALGYRMRKNLVTRVKGTDGSRKLFDVQYRSDGYGRRIVPTTSDENRTKHFIILGGSTVFGMGLPDNETLASYLSERARHYRTYNYAGDGYGPQNAYAQASAGLLADEIPEAEGTTVFFFQMLQHSGGQIQTLLGNFELLLTGWGENLPFYGFDSTVSESPKFIGRMKDSSPVKFYGFRFLQNFHLLNTLAPKIFPISNEDMQQAAYFMKEMKTQVLKSKPQTRFLVAIHPLSDRNIVASFQKLLNQYEVETIDYSKLVPEDKLSEHIAFNRFFPHPNGKLNAIFANQMAIDLELN